MASDNGGGWLPWILGSYIAYLLITGAWHSKVRYFVQYGLPQGPNWDQVTKEKAPHDCEWLKAPLGEKYCHYDAVVSSGRISKDSKTGNPIWSSDDGKTWSWYDATNPSRVMPHVYVGWEKVED
jgi:hypothetical protein